MRTAVTKITGKKKQPKKEKRKKEKEIQTQMNERGKIQKKKNLHQDPNK